MSEDRIPLISGVTNKVQVRSKNYLPTAYAVGKVFTGVTLPNDIDLNTYVTPGVSRVNTYKNGPPVTSPGYLVIHSVNLDEDESGVGLRYRQIYYPDSTTETTPYTRVGTGTPDDVITWSTWTTMGGNWVCETLTSNKTAIVNYMYHSFGPYTLTLPNPTLYTVGTRIGLTQWGGEGKVVYGDFSQVTTPDLDKTGKTIGALQYIFQIVPDEDGVNQWSLDIDQDLSDWLNDMRLGLQTSIDSLTDKHNEDVSNLETLIKNTETTLQASINKEISDRVNADKALDSKLTTALNSAVSTLNTKISILDRDKKRDTKTLINTANATFVYTTGDSATLTNNLAKYNYRVMVSGSGTISLPASVSEHGVSVVLFIQPNISCTVRAGSVSEVFKNVDANSVLVIDMQVVATASGQYTWTVLEVG